MTANGKLRRQPFGLALLAIVIALPHPVCRAQDDDLAHFGTTVVIPGGLTGKIYFLKPNTWVLPNFETLEPVGAIYAKGFDITPRDFRFGFPGITQRTEWFAIDFQGYFYIEKPAVYSFKLESDDGAKLYIDGRVVIDNDGDHHSLARMETVHLDAGVHAMRLSYFQGPGYELSLMLNISGPGNKSFHPFNTDRFKPPTDPDKWQSAPPKAWEKIAGTGLLRRPSDPSVLVPVAVGVRAHGKPAAELAQTDFTIDDAGHPADITAFSAGPQPLDLVLLVDENSALGPLRRRLGDMALKAFSKLDHRDHVAIIGCGKTQTLTIGFCNRPDKLADAILQIPASKDATDWSDAIAVATLYLRDAARPEATSAILMLGSNQGSQPAASRGVRDALWQSNISLSGLFTRPEATGNIQNLIEVSGGSQLKMDPKSIPLVETFERLRERYRITLKVPQGAQPKQIRSLSINLSAAAKTSLGDVEIAAPHAYVAAPR